MESFDDEMSKRQVAWRQQHVADRRHGYFHGRPYAWILPPELWEEGLWPRIRTGSQWSLPKYLADSNIQRHVASHNLKSSWTQCANLYFPFGQDHGRQLLAGFLRQHVCGEIRSVDGVELEYAGGPPLDPQTLLGEADEGRRGANQTSPDVAFIVRTARGRGLILIENKLTETSFGRCSGRKTGANNPDRNRCMDFGQLMGDLSGQCWQLQWELEGRTNRRYWEHIRFTEQAREILTRCPAATSGYQLFRQQAMAEGIAVNGDYGPVISCVAYDARNDALLRCLASTGIGNFTGWGQLFNRQARFATFTHQQWVEWVRQHDDDRQWTCWLRYVRERYGYG